MQIIKNGFLLRKKEFYLSIIVFFYLVISFSVISRYVGSDFIPFIQLFFLLAENYITVAVYYGIRESLWEETLNIPNMFIKGGTFFFRVLAYKLLAGLFIIIIAAFCLSMIEMVKDSSLVTAGFITAFTVFWLSFPVYLCFLTALAPLIIIADDISLIQAIKTSMSFIREHLASIGKILLLLMPLWFLVIFFLKMYNEKGLFLQTSVFYLMSMLEIITVKIFLLFYKIER